MEVQAIIKKIHEARGTHLHTTDDVKFVLSFIAPSGEKQELKKRVVQQLFPNKSRQGYTTADTLSSYEEY